MSRIRSVHPGLFTDEAFVALSDSAQIFLVGLWTEADDQGIFEWKPMTLKMRLRPASLLPVEPLLGELLAGNAVRTFSVSGKQYGALRNFRKFQRPKYPNAIHPISDDIRNYVGLTQPIPEVGCDDEKPNQQNQDQMEDGEEEEDNKQEDIGSGEPTDIGPEAWGSINGRSPNSIADAVFESYFWPAYPETKGNKQPAKIKFRAALKHDNAERIIAGLALYRAKRETVAEPQFTKRAATWLNQRGWQDENEEFEQCA